MAAFSDIVIKSSDIDQSLFSEENHRSLKAKFPHLEDDTIARYLIARNNNLEKADELLTKSQKWRNVHFPILKQDCITELRKAKVYTHGHDKEGRPLLIVHGVRHIPGDRNMEETAKAALWMMEQVIKRLPEDKTKYTILMDRSGAGLANQDIEFTKHFTKLFQDQHPERLCRAIVYPSGLIFWSLWNVVKWFLDPVTRDKVCPIMYFSGVQQYIDDEFIPSTIVSPFPRSRLHVTFYWF